MDAPLITPQMMARAARAQATQDATNTPHAVAVPDDTTKARLARWAMILGGQGLDAGTTIKALLDPRFKEANSIYGEHPSVGRVLATKGAIAGVGGWMTDRMAKKHPKAAMVTSGVLGLSGLLPGLLNLHTMSSVKKD